MDRSAVKALRKRNYTVDQIAAQMGMDPKTVMSILNGPTERKAQKRDRKSRVDAFRDEIRAWLKKKVPVKRMLELAQEAPEPYSGGRSEFYSQVAELRRELKLAAQEAIVRFEGIPGEYCQIDWGELRNLAFLKQPAGSTVGVSWGGGSQAWAGG